MKAIYRGKLYTQGDNLNECDLHYASGELALTVPYGDPELIVDPTDGQMAGLKLDCDCGMYEAFEECDCAGGKMNIDAIIARSYGFKPFK